jgi:hypothetical protein
MATKLLNPSWLDRALFPFTSRTIEGTADAALSQQPRAHLARSKALHPGKCTGRNLPSHSSVGHLLRDRASIQIL